jgi:hypothetical protein
MLFTALSYVWGDPRVAQLNLVNGQVFNVTTNLGAFMQQARLAQGSEKGALNEPKQHWPKFRKFLDKI